MTVSAGDLKCKAIYYGDVLLWAITSDGGEYLNGTWEDDLLWDDNEVWNE